MKLPLRIAILECDRPLDKTTAQYGRYGRVFRQLLERAADALGHPGLDAKQGLEISYWAVEAEDKFPDLEDIDAIMMTGSSETILTEYHGRVLMHVGYNPFDDTPWIVHLVEFTQKVLQQDRVRILAVCFGHQIIGRALGLPVGRSDVGWEVSVVPVSLTSFGKEVFQQDRLVSRLHKASQHGIVTRATEPLSDAPRHCARHT
jgi:GMP synthase-like glutamine amidotransferase